MGQITFLGSGGGRWATITQRVSTAGFRLELGKEIIQIDPGPGAILRCREMGINPQKTTAVFCSHCHLDHYNDLEVMIEAMCMDKKNHGILLGSESIVNGFEKFERPFSDYHKSLLKECGAMSPGDSYSLDSVKVTAKKTAHEDPKTVGAVFESDEARVAYVADTSYFQGIAEEYSGCDLLVVNVMRPDNDRIPWHLCTEDVEKLVKDAKPRQVVMNHFGLKMLSAMPDAQAAKVQKGTGVKTRAARDGLVVKVGNEPGTNR